MTHPVEPKPPVPEAWAYLITFACYGSRLHGDPRGSVDRNRNAYRGRYIPANSNWRDHAARSMTHDCWMMDASARATALAAIRDACEGQAWELHAAHVRTNHIHTVVSAGDPPEPLMGRFKAYCSRSLNDRFGHRGKRWARHGSTLWLWDALDSSAAVEYVVRGQGAPMACYLNSRIWPEFNDA